MSRYNSYRLSSKRSAKNWIAAAVSAAVAGQSQGLTFNTSYDTSVLLSPFAAQFITAFNYTTAQFSAMYSNPVTINITATLTPGSLGSASAARVNSSFAPYVIALNSVATSPSDTIAANSLLGFPDPTFGSQIQIPRAQAKVLGMVGANDSASDGTINFDSNSTFTFNTTSSRAVPGAADFVGVAFHEISHLMGRYPGLNKYTPGGFSSLDLFAIRTVT